MNKAVFSQTNHSGAWHSTYTVEKCNAKVLKGLFWFRPSIEQYQNSWFTSVSGSWTARLWPMVAVLVCHWMWFECVNSVWCMMIVYSRQQQQQLERYSESAYLRQGNGQSAIRHAGMPVFCVCVCVCVCVCARVNNIFLAKVITASRKYFSIHNMHNTIR